MTLSAIDRVALHSDTTMLPVRLSQHSSRLVALKFALLALPPLACTLATLGLATRLAIDMPETLAILATRPLSVLAIAFGLTALLALTAYPIYRTCQRWRFGTIIEMDRHEVRISSGAPRSPREHREPISAYTGIARRTRTTLSGTQREIVLVHGHGRHILLALENPADTDATATFAELLDMPVITFPHRISVRHSRENTATTPALPLATTEGVLASVAQQA